MLLKRFKDIDGELISKIENLLNDYLINLIEDDFVNFYEEDYDLYVKVKLKDKSDSVMNIINHEIYFNNQIKFSQACLTTIKYVEMVCNQYNLEYEYIDQNIDLDVFIIKIIFDDIETNFK